MVRFPFWFADDDEVQLLGCMYNNNFATAAG